MIRMAAFGGISILSFCLALINDEQSGKPPQESATSNANEKSRVGELDKKTTGANVRIGQLIGMGIQNTKGEDVGDIVDLVINAQSGKVQYAAVTYGGFLGLGTKMFAVPFEAFKVEVHPRFHERHVMILDVSQEQLEGAVGFDHGRWPNFADRKFTDDLDQRYRVGRSAGGDKSKKSSTTDSELDR